MQEELSEKTINLPASPEISRPDRGMVAEGLPRNRRDPWCPWCRRATWAAILQGGDDKASENLFNTWGSQHDITQVITMCRKPLHPDQYSDNGI